MKVYNKVNVWLSTSSNEHFYFFLSKGDFICKCVVLRNNTKVVSAIRVT